VLASFDGSISDWVLSGEAMNVQPRAAAVGNQHAIEGMIGTGMLDSFDATRGDDVVGDAFSPEFVVSPGTQLVFLVGGGASQRVGVDLVTDGTVATHWSGHDSERLVPIVFDLTRFAGRHLQLHVFDHATGPWGHTVVDHFVLMQ
jgi:levanase